MALKAKLSPADYEKLPDALKTEYKQIDGTEEYELDVEGDETKAKLNEFRANNIRLERERKQLQAQADKFKDVDLDKYKKALEALEKVDQLDDAELVKKGDLDALFKKRTDALRQDNENQLAQMRKDAKGLTEERDTYRTKLGEHIVNQSALNALTKAGRLRPEAQDDAIARAHRTWKINEKGEAVPLDDNGGIIYGKGGDNALTFDEWASKLVTTAPHLFESGQGGGATGGRRKETEAGKKFVANDAVTVGRNLEKIAKGEVIVAGSELSQ